MYSFMSDGAEFLAPSINKLSATTLGDVGTALMGRGPMAPIQREFGTQARNLANAIPGVGPRAAVNVGRFAGRAMPLLSVLSNVSDVADIVAGDESLANKAMDVAAMGTGAAIGGFLGGGVFSPLTASVGASIGKTVSDGAQWLFGDKKTPEQRKMELALRQLQGGGMYS